ncbi:MAG TPA: sodium:solute symporter family protein [Pyrinomonadaceae bacterium]|nr:sodium:solute symporter family protein [Pyrinomonadaceae bacterium]
MNAVLIGVLVYVLAQLVIGLLVSRRISTQEDYILAGRSLGFGLATFTIFATWFGAETCIGSAGAIYEEGLSGGSADPFGYGLCLLLMGLVFAAPLWRRRLITLADLFRNRYSPKVERIAVLMMVPSSVIWAAAQIRAFGQVLSASSEVGVTVAITIAAAAVVIYTVSGGLLADAITDLIQGVALILGLIILLLTVVYLMGGVENVIARIRPEQLRIFGGGDTSLAVMLEAWAVPICGSVVAQELVSRVIAARSEEVARRSALAAAGIYIMVGMIPVLIGLVGASLIPDLKEPEHILPLIAQQHLSTLLYIFFAGALVSAILSTVDSTLLVAASLVSQNLIVSWHPELKEKTKLRVSRIGVVVFGLVAYWIALYAEGIYQLVKDASAFGSAGIFIVVVFGLFTRFGGARSALAALLFGMAVWVYGKYVSGFAYSYLSSLGTALITYISVALIEHKRASWLSS